VNFGTTRINKVLKFSRFWKLYCWYTL